MAQPSALADLCGHLERARVRSISSKYFIQPSKVREIFSPERVKASLAEVKCEKHEEIGLIDQIQHHGVLTFAILVWRRRADSIVAFRNADCLDRRLPIDEKKAQDIVPDFGLSFAKEYQWEFLPYTFRRDMADSHHVIHDLNMIFPVLEEEIVGEGGFGVISRLKVLSNMQEFFPDIDNRTVTVIQKRIKRRPGQSIETHNRAFKNEMVSLRLLSRLGHSSIIRLLGSYTFAGHHYLLFPSYNMDLQRLFTLTHTVPEFEEDHAICLAVADLASALENTHDLHINEEEHGVDFNGMGYHYDISPSNVLLNSKTSTFVLADFGLGKVQDKKSNSETPWKVGGGDYIAPECMNAQWQRQKVGRSVDVWAFGCLVTELVTYMTRGPDGVRHFRELRREDIQPGWETSYFFTRERTMKPSVRNWIGTLSSSTSKSMRQMLQIALAALEPDPKERVRMLSLRQRLNTVALEALYRVTRGTLSGFIDERATLTPQSPFHMQMWFIRQRFEALHHALLSNSDKSGLVLDDTQSYQNICTCMTTLLRTIRARSSDHTQGAVDDLPGSTDSALGLVIEKLWEYLPASAGRTAQALWIQSMQCEDLERLGDIEAQTDIHQPQQHRDIAATAHMRSIRLRMLSDPNTVANDFLHPWDDLDCFESIGRHTYARFSKQTRVLVEWVYYRLEWTSISVDQRLAIMEWRARDFNTDPKPSGLCIPKCLGFVEVPPEQGRRQGYGFLYALPGPNQDGEYPVTLQDLLMKGIDRGGPQHQAPLQGRFKLAYALALFFYELYTVKFLHESFSSSNVLFNQNAAVMFASSDAWSKPFIVGFEKSRPDSHSWSTEGPSDDTSMLDYEHPAYRHAKRFVLEYDYYSLGLVLLEIGLWYPMRAWSNKHNTLSPKDLRSLLIARYVPRLMTSVGEIYEGVVRSCLDGTFERERKPSTAKAADSEVFCHFIDKVLEPLEGLATLRL